MALVDARVLSSEMGQTAVVGDQAHRKSTPSLRADIQGAATASRPIEKADLSLSLNARFRGPLMSFFLRRIRNHADAEDLTQQVFLRILAANDNLQVESAEAFIFKVAANLLLDRARQGARRGGTHTPLDEAVIGEIVGELMEQRSPERVLLGQETLAEVLSALDELGQRTRNIFILFRLENLKQREIATIYGISASTVEKQVMRATLHLALKFGSPDR